MSCQNGCPHIMEVGRYVVFVLSYHNKIPTLSVLVLPKRHPKLLLESLVFFMCRLVKSQKKSVAYHERDVVRNPQIMHQQNANMFPTHWAPVWVKNKDALKLIWTYAMLFRVEWDAREGGK